MPRFHRRVRSSFVVSLITRALLALAVILPLASCATEPITGRRVFLGLVGEAEINGMGVQAYDQILKDSKLSTNPQYNDLVQRVGARIAKVVNRRMMDAGRQPYEWNFVVIDDPSVNAFALPGGKVAFYTGILPICQDEAGVAVVMGHEIGHAYGEHGRKRVNEAVLSQFSLQAAQAALSSQENEELAALTMAALGIGVQGVTLKFSRGDESSADEIGLILMAEAGYDPRPAVDFWQRMAAASGGGAPPKFLSTHPSHKTRVRQLQEMMPRALRIYEATKSAGE
jgi:predicted Zn-dependent protease